MYLKKEHIIATLFFAFTSSAMFAQYVVQGKVVSAASKEPVPNAEVFLTALRKSTITNDFGDFKFQDIPKGTYNFTVFAYEFAILDHAVSISDDTFLNLKLESLGIELSEVVVTQRKERIFALKQLRDVEGTTIYAGKKSEVVVVNSLTANLASGNARQIYSQVVGLNIYENNDAGLQLNIGGRGLNPNRSANFNTRQNGYDISADVLGYPESYYTPPAESISEIEVVRGAASLQYGPQFGGLINFKLKQPNTYKKLEWISRQSLGSYDLFTSFNSIGGTLKNMGYYSFFNYKKGNSFRPNSQFESFNGYAHLEYSLTERTKISFEASYLNYLAQQPGGLTDKQFEEDPTFSNRTRNWFNVDWKLYAMRLEHALNNKTDFSLYLFALDAFRKSVGFRENRVSQEDDLEAPRELIVGNFNNWGAEARLLTRYNFFGKKNTVLFGGKYYQSNNTERQGPGSSGSNANFNFEEQTYPNYPRQSDFKFPNLNLALFSENVFRFSEKFSVTPGLRFEYIKTRSRGEFKRINFDIAGNPILNEDVADNRDLERSFILLGVGLSYKPYKMVELYGNISQNYRSVTFNDIRITNPSLTVDPNINDEQGYTFDVGARGKIKKYISYDVGAFFLSYKDRLGVILREVSDVQQERFRGNIGDAITYGAESFVDWNVWETVSTEKNDIKLNTFINIALTDSKYTSSQENNVKGKKVEFIPGINLKTGIMFGYKDFLTSLQYTYLSKQFTDATNSPRDFDSQSGIIGEIPAYEIMDLSFSYTYNRFKLETGVNNVLDESYFTRRATGYPGPGIIPSSPRTFYALLQFKF